MGLKKLFAIMKNEGVVIPAIDKYLLTVGEDEGRNHGWNSPSGVSQCPLGQWYVRNGEKKDGSIDPRTRRIFNNGTHTHERLQEYMLKSGILLMDEVPVWDRELMILGHTDGIIRLNKFNLAVLEIKSINSNGFQKLIDAKDEHKEQAQVYMMALEKLRKEIHDNATTEEEYLQYKGTLLCYFLDLIDTFVEGGRKYTKEQKIAHQLRQMGKTFDILWECPKPINTMVFLYENKDNQELKEYTVKWNDELVVDLTERYTYINAYVKGKKAPPRPAEATGKSCGYCRWCNFKLKCFH